MSNFSEQAESKKEAKEKNRVRKEKLAGFFYNLAQLTFAALVLGGITPLFADMHTTSNIITLPLGCVTTYWLATTANRILKY